MNENKTPLQRIHEELAKFEKTMAEIHLLKCVAADLRSYRRMIRVKKYD
ncbi:hypothetical protein MUP01_05225 [Candidatus Bathyarchaeota archaeon]|nr:hypothetical protein [Candidatus Bathyarchaeota archaeon]